VKHTIRSTAAAVALLAVAGCTTGSTHSSAAASDTPSATLSAVAASCLTQFHHWWSSGASTKFNAVIAGLEEANKLADNVGALQAAVAKTAAESKTFLADPAPDCVPGMRTDLDTALNDFIAAAGYIDTGRATDLQTGAVKLKDGADAMRRVAADLSRSLR
jgi:hypothetical protein